jgi:hypothetical protein
MTDSASRAPRGPRPALARPGLCLVLLLTVAVLIGPKATLLARQDGNTPAQPQAVPTLPPQPGAPTVLPSVPVAQVVPGGPPQQAVFQTIDGSGRVTVFNAPSQVVIPPIDPKMPIKELLPTPPKVEKVRPGTSEDLTKVPEVQIQAPLTREMDSLQQTAILLAKINHINRSETDGFLKALVAERQDLAGLPYAMGDACRTKGERNRQFAIAVNTVRQAMGQQSVPPQSVPVLPLSGVPVPAPNLPTPLQPFPPQALQVNPAPTPAPAPVPPPPQERPQIAPTTVATVEVQPNTPAASFWTQFQTLCDQQDAAQARVDKEQCDHVAIARIAALMQILAPESPSYRLGLIKYLSGVAHPEATRALARLAVFSAEDDIRLAAVNALQVRRERDYTDILVRGLRYPYPKVSRNAVDAIVRLKREDLLPQLVALLEEPDPRAPQDKEEGAKKVTVVSEMVRINHHRNCALCHSPGTNGDVGNDTLTAGVPLPNEPLSGPSGGYRNSRSETLVRLDVTYLRQDFSMFQAVADANPWPEMQRFDFLVRTRQLTGEEAVAYREQFGSSDPTRPSAYQKAALAGLREMTGRDTAPTGEAWRKLLSLPARPQGKGTADISAPGPVSLQR